LSRTDRKLEVDAEVTEYKKGITGIDRTKTEVTHTFYKWDLEAMRSEWTYKSSHDGTIRVWGGTRIEPAGAETRVTEEFNVEVKIPLMGGKIERSILKEVDSFWPKFELLLQQYCQKMA
jgi:hypothetical protein